MPKKYQSRLHDKPFQEIQNGSKKVGCRLNDKKRRQFKVGDIIEFISRSNPENKIEVIIKNLEIFHNFNNLFQEISPNLTGIKTKPEEAAQQMLEFYSIEEQNKHGVVAIHIASPRR